MSWNGCTGFSVVFETQFLVYFGRQHFLKPAQNSIDLLFSSCSESFLKCSRQYMYCNALFSVCLNRLSKHVNYGVVNVSKFNEGIIIM